MTLPEGPTSRDLLSGLLAERLDDVGRGRLLAALDDWDPIRSGPLSSLLAERDLLDPADRSRLEALLEDALGRDGPGGTSPEGRPGAPRTVASLLRDVLSCLTPAPRTEVADTPTASIAPTEAAETSADPMATQPATGLLDPLATAIPETQVATRPPDAPELDPLATVVHPASGAAALPTEAWSEPDAGGQAVGGGRRRTGGRRYQVLRPHARGGLGAVFLAQDLELQREVALKEIQERHADHPQLRARFLLEAEVTGCLEHPGIVPIYGLGQDEDGRPYYAMRFIEGESLNAAIKRLHREGPDPVLLRRLLMQFVDVCEAIAYAHSRGVIHRDLKPDNVMLGKFGETLVVDWGLAKPMGRCFATDVQPGGPADRSRLRPGDPKSSDPDRAEPTQDAGASGSSIRTDRPLIPSQQTRASETLAGSALGTPQYMSPEQARGDLDALGPACDIYSLGATLYCLLTGQPPFTERNLQAVLARVRAGDFPRPRQLDPAIHPALEAIALKAMALAPADRYPTAKLLGQDLVNWLSDEPVSAYPEPWTTRAARWARRHRTIVATAAGLVVTTTLALGIGAGLLERERARTDRERRLALANYQQAYEAADTMLSEVGDVELADVPQMEPVRRRLLETARARFSRLLEQHSDDPQVRLLAGRTLTRLGDVLAMLGSFGPAERSYREAIRALDALAAAAPGHDRPRRELADAHRGLGILLRESNRFVEAEAELREAIRAAEPIVAAHPDDLDARRRLGEGRYHLGALLARQARRSSEDERLYQQAIADQEATREADGGDVASSERRARYLNNLAVLVARTRPEEAEARFREILDAVDRLDESARALPGPRWQRARASNNLAALHMRPGADAPDVDDRLRTARRVLETLHAEFPRIPQYARELAIVYRNLALRESGLGQDEAARSWLQKAVDLLSGLARDFPDVPDHRQRLAFALTERAVLEAEAAPDDARAGLGAALEILEQLATKYPQVPEYANELGRAYYNRGLLLQERDPDAAREDAERAARRHGDLHRAEPDHELYRRNLYEDQALLVVLAARGADAARVARLAEELPTLMPNEPESYVRAAAGLAAAAEISSSGRPAPAAPATADDYRRRAVRILRQAGEKGVAIDPSQLEILELAPLDGFHEFEELRRELANPPAPGARTASTDRDPGPRTQSIDG